MTSSETFKYKGNVVTTVGAILHTGKLERGGRPEIVFVEKTDANWHVRLGNLVNGSRQKVDAPETMVPYPAWVIPSGHVEPSDTTLEAALAREIKEEVGLIIADEKLVCLDYFDPTAFRTHPKDYIPKKGALIFSYNIDRSDLLNLGENQIVEDITIIVPGKITANSETGRIALVPNFKLYGDHPIVTWNYRWEYGKQLKMFFESRFII